MTHYFDSEHLTLDALRNFYDFSVNKVPSINIFLLNKYKCFKDLYESRLVTVDVDAKRKVQ